MIYLSFISHLSIHTYHTRKHLTCTLPLLFVFYYSRRSMNGTLYILYCYNIQIHFALLYTIHLYREDTCSQSFGYMVLFHSLTPKPSLASWFAVYTSVTLLCVFFQRLSVCQQSQGESVSSPLPSQPSQGESSPCSDISSYEEPPSPLSAASSSPVGPPRGPSTSDPEDLPTLSEHFLPCDPTKWNVQEVFEFIRSLPGQ